MKQFKVSITCIIFGHSLKSLQTVFFSSLTLVHWSQRSSPFSGIFGQSHTRSMPGLQCTISISVKVSPIWLPSLPDFGIRNYLHQIPVDIILMLPIKYIPSIAWRLVIQCHLSTRCNLSISHWGVRSVVFQSQKNWTRALLSWPCHALSKLYVYLAVSPFWYQPFVAANHFHIHFII